MTFILSMRLLDSLRLTAALAAFILLVNQMAGHHSRAQTVQALPAFVSSTMFTTFIDK